METFLSIHQDNLVGSLTTFDRMIFKSHLTMLYPQGAFARLLYRQGVLLKDFRPYVEGVSQKIKEHAEQLASEAGRPFRYLEASITVKNGQGKEAMAQQIVAEDHLKDGLVCSTHWNPVPHSRCGGTGTETGSRPALQQMFALQKAA